MNIHRLPFILSRHNALFVVTKNSALMTAYLLVMPWYTRQSFFQVGTDNALKIIPIIMLTC
ncbi:MAG: hypothetical protein CBC12_03605 [Candidatus Puniceispirillum sp. TMED52]|nr:hypothetical protein [SAR116 cluster bacterium]OUU52347.1 MAG: hypothetical protein CBC12_03605 [Candidatus Puniceispirillum sp. TMED52]HCP19297.1 hypothetical protein [Alphaproteobacteria bacterium]